MNKKKSYALINTKTGKVIEYNYEKQIFRLKEAARTTKNRLQAELGIEIEIKKLDPL